ncbi:MAG: class II fumarate hydratase [Actinomycetota bacterium]|jgi:fumarate hydratase class II|nr:class II fumarate hydratase [Actinomycetota bacterium]MDA3008973.1 class II fumarate hydratase [Actinomycetota bacterium]MDA3036960.1 class II fumarate hydratase [Actinomycetota bacterium]
MTEQFRTEKDSMGEFQVPIDAKYGASTARAVENFPISNLRFSRSFIKALGEIKKACANVNQKNKLLDKNFADSIIDAAQQVIDGDHDKDFVVDIFQTGSGTSTNMNVNEIISKIASESLSENIHPNDHVNMSQSSNDVIPTATNVAAVTEIVQNLIPAVESLIQSLEDKGKKWEKVYKNGRTHLMDATPVSLGQEFSGYAALLSERLEDIKFSLMNASKLAIGGTAVGTGINAPDNFGKEVAKEISKSLGINFVEVENHFTRQGSREEVVQLSGCLKAFAVSMFKIANDIRWMGSGPVSGLNELIIPELQPGSSIMPGKVNPVIPEMVMQVSAQVIGNDNAITFSSSNGNFELNTMLPVMAHNLLESIELLTTSTNVFEKKLIHDLEANTEKLDENIQKNSILVTALVPVIGYDKSAEVAKEAMSQNKTIKEVLIEKNLISSEEIDELLNIEKLI